MPFSFCYPRQHAVFNVDRVGPFAFRNGNRHGRQKLPRAGAHCSHILRWIFACVVYFSHIPHEYRSFLRNSDNYVPNVLGSAQEVSGFESIFAVVLVELACRQLTVREIERPGHAERCQLMRLQFRLIQPDSNLPPLPPNQFHARNVRNLLDRIVDLRGNSAQLQIAVPLADSVSARMGTSSIKCGFTIGWLAPGGIKSK